MSEITAPITQLLANVAQGDAASREKLWSVVYDELRIIARHQMASEGNGRTLQATALVNEAYLRLLGHEKIDWNNRCHFFAAAAKIMRRIRVDDARRRNALKRGGDCHRIATDGEDEMDLATLTVCEDDVEQTLALDEAMQRLAELDPIAAEVVEQRYFGGMTRDQVCEAIGIAPRTADKHWHSARAWLFGQLSGQREGDGDS